MKKIVLIIPFLLVTFCGFAQLSIGYKQGYGGHGVNMEPDALNFNMVDLYLWNYGLVLSYTNAHNAGLSTELNYAQKGWREEDEDVEGSYYQKVITYLEVPFFSHWEIGKKKSRIMINVGPYFGFKLSEEVSTANYEHVLEGAPYEQYTLPIRQIDFGMKVGIGYRYNFTKRFGVFAEARYDLEIAGGRDIFIGRPNNISASRLKETSGTIGVLWHIIPQKVIEEKKGYVPKDDTYINPTSGQHQK